MTKVKPYDTVVLLEPIDIFQKGEKGAVIEVYTIPYEAYDLEIVTDAGQTKGLIEGVRPHQIELLTSEPVSIRFEFIHIEANGARAAVRFSDGTEMMVAAEELYGQRS